MLIQEHIRREKMAKLYFRYGAMGCGKTTALLQVIHNYKKNNLNIVLIKPSIDKKGNNKIVSRLGIESDVDILLTPSSIVMDNIDLNDLTCILVDEAQFLTFNQVKELWLISKLTDIPVICYGLKTNFKGEFFTGSKSLMELADEIEELVTICSCGKKAKFNARKNNDEYTLIGDEVAIDGIDAEYEALCPKCYINKVLKINRLNTSKKC